MTGSSMRVCVRACTLMLLLLGSTGCRRSELRPVKPALTLPESFSVVGGELLPTKWWEVLEDPNLDRLIDQALSANFTIRSAWDRLYQAEQIALKATVPALPSVTYSASARRSRQEIAGRTTSATALGLGLNAAYEVDLWGRIDSARKAAFLDVESRREDLAAAAITLSATVAKTWYQLAEAKEQVAILNRQIKTNEEVLQIVSLQFRNAKVGAPDVFRQRQLVEATRGQLVQVEASVMLLQHLLSVLLGQTPQTRWVDQAIPLPSPAELPEVTVPSELMQRRPDVVSAYKSVQAADQRAAVAAADRYPSISLSASASTSGSRVEDLFDDWAASLAGALVGPLFDGGLREAEVERTRAVVSQAIHDYSQVVLNALKEVEDALSREAYQRAYVLNLRQQLALAGQGYQSTHRRYINGQLDYLRVLDTLVSLQSLERNELSARRVLLEDRIDLCRAIAGPWVMSPPPLARLQEN